MGRFSNLFKKRTSITDITQIPVIDTPDPIAIRPGNESQFAAAVAERQRLAPPSTPAVVEGAVSHARFFAAVEPTHSPDEARLAAGAPIESLEWATRLAQRRMADEQYYERNPELRGRDPHGPPPSAHAAMYNYGRPDGIHFSRVDTGGPLGIMALMRPEQQYVAPNDTLRPDMRGLRDQVRQTPYGSTPDLVAEPVRTTELKRPYVDPDTGYQHYNPSIYAAQLSVADRGSSSATHDASRHDPGAPIRLPTGSTEQPPTFGHARSHNLTPTYGAPAYVPQNTTGVGRHHMYGNPAVGREATVTPFKPDFSWATNDPPPPPDSLRSYMQNVLYPKDDRVFDPRTAAARGFRPASSAALGGGHDQSGRGGGNGTAGSPAAVGARTVSPPRFRVVSMNKDLHGKELSPEKKHSPVRLPGGAIGLQPIAAYDVPPTERYSHRGWSHLGHTNPTSGFSVQLPPSPRDRRHTTPRRS